jgi:hypothetical protein
MWYRRDMMNDLGLDLSRLAAPGRKTHRLEANIVRELRESDFALLETRPAVQAFDIKRLTERHHSLARLLAGGVPPGEAAVITGYVPSRVSVLQESPAFRELVAFYSDAKDVQFAQVHEQIAGLSKDALLELRTRLEDSPEDFSNGMLLELITKTLDRSGFGPTSQVTAVNINVELGNRIEQARLRARAAARGDLIEGTVETSDWTPASDT